MLGRKIGAQRKRNRGRPLLMKCQKGGQKEREGEIIKKE